MQVSVLTGDAVRSKVPVVIVCHFEDENRPSGYAAHADTITGKLVTDLLTAGDFKGKMNETLLAYSRTDDGARRILLIGLGKRSEFTLDRYRGTFSTAARYLRDRRITTIAFQAETPVHDFTVSEAVAAAVDGMLLGLYRFTPFKTNDDTTAAMEDCRIFVDSDADLKAIRSAADEARQIADAVAFTRDLVSSPANEMTPVIMASKALELASSSVRVTVLERDEIEQLGMNALIGVAKGSSEPPRFIILEYTGSSETSPPIVLVGKGVTFDSGGICIKPADKMDQMKDDMAGGAAVMGTIKAAATLSLPIDIVGIIPAAENLPGGSAYKPSDVLRSHSGKTIEVINTDAEGRLLLADALSYGHSRYRPQAMIDIATLTGACLVALGEDIIGMLGTHVTVKERLTASAQATGEFLWELPLWDDYNELIKSDIADVKNTGPRFAGTITAALFLKKFTGTTPWVHLDIAGPSWASKDKPYIPKGASGCGVRLLVHCLKNWTDLDE